MDRAPYHKANRYVVEYTTLGFTQWFMQAKVSGLMSFYKFYKMPYLFCTCLFQMRGLGE